MNLFPNLAPKTGRLPAGIDLRCCGVEDVLAEVRGARLVIADPPWQYDFSGSGPKTVEGHYPCLPIAQIREHVNKAGTCCQQSAYLALWVTWPILPDWLADSCDWRYISGGVWSKSGTGIGFHWRGNSEPVLLYVQGTPRPVLKNLSNCHASERGEHSAKPAAWMRAWIRAWTEPGDLVLDLYAGLGSVAVACALEGRRYVGAEIDAERHRRAVLSVERALGGGV